MLPVLPSLLATHFDEGRYLWWHLWHRQWKMFFLARMMIIINLLRQSTWVKMPSVVGWNWWIVPYFPILDPLACFLPTFRWKLHFETCSILGPIKKLPNFPFCDEGMLGYSLWHVANDDNVFFSNEEEDIWLCCHLYWPSTLMRARPPGREFRPLLLKKEVMMMIKIIKIILTMMMMMATRKTHRLFRKLPFVTGACGKNVARGKSANFPLWRL